VAHGCHVQFPTRLRQLGQEPVSNRTERLRWFLYLIRAIAGLAPLNVLAQAPISVVAASAGVPDLRLQIGVAVRRRHEGGG
jgi:hypothetical protein